MLYHLDITTPNILFVSIIIKNDNFTIQLSKLIGDLLVSYANNFINSVKTNKMIILIGLKFNPETRDVDLRT